MGEQAGVLHFRASDVPPAERRAVLQENFCRGVLNIDFTPVGEELDFEIELRELAGIILTSGWHSPHHATNHDRSLDRDDFLLVWATGGGRISHMGREIESERHVAFLSCGERVTADTRHAVHHRTLRIPRSMLNRLLPNADDFLARPLSTRSEAFRLLKDYVALLRRRTFTEREAAQLAATHVAELVALTVRGAEPSTRFDAQGSVRTARLEAIKAWARLRLTNHGLSVSAAASAHLLSERYVQLLFNAERTTFSDFVRSERLALVHQRLLCGDLSHRSISDLAFDAGFGDLSYFNRSFRAAFGETPSDVRSRIRSIPASAFADKPDFASVQDTPARNT